MSVKIIECPRDAMQGIDEFIPTQTKIDYINSILKVGFDTIDFGSFVSPKAIPQLRDTADVLAGLNLDNTESDLLAIIANKRGAEDASQFDEISFLGYPFSISETFQQRNTNASIDQSFGRVEEIQNLATLHGKKVVIYISMAFGNPYGDAWSPELASEWISKLNSELDIQVFALADTIGISDQKNIQSMFETVIPSFEQLEIGAHLHSTYDDAFNKAQAAYNAGCRRFDGAIKGYGGCPMAEDELVGNMPTEVMISALGSLDKLGLSENRFDDAMKKALETFPT